MTDLRQTAVALSTAVAAGDDSAAAAILADLTRAQTGIVAALIARFYVNGIRKYAEAVGLPLVDFQVAVLRDLGVKFAADATTPP